VAKKISNGLALETYATKPRLIPSPMTVTFYVGAGVLSCALLLLKHDVEITLQKK
jgi:hypothetical protein